MATVIDALTVTLGLDAAQFKKGQQETQEALKQTESAATRTAKTMQAEGGRAAEFFTAAKIEALAFLGVLTGGAGLIAGFKDTAAGLNAVNRAAIASGESTQFIQAFSAAIGRTGGNVETAKQQLIAFAAVVEQFKLRGGASPLAQYSEILGIDPLNAKPEQVIEGIMRVIERNPGAAGRQYVLNMGNQLGVPNDLMLSLIQIGTLANLQAAIQHSIEIGAVQTEKQIKAAIDFQNAVTEFDQAIKGLITALIPFEWMARQIHGLTEEMTHPPQISKDEPAGYRWLREHMPSWLGGGGPPSGPSHRSAAPGEGLSGPGLWSGGGASATAAQESLAFWMSKGLPAHQAAGMVAQEMAESRGDAGARGDYVDAYGRPVSRDTPGAIPTAHGAYQWHGDRRRAILGGTGIDVSSASIDQQREAAWWELTHRETEAYRRLRAATNADEAGRAATEFERPDPRRRAIIDAERGRDASRLIGAGPRSSPLIPHRMLRPEDMMSPIGPTSSSNSHEMHIGNVNVYPPNGDSKTIAQSIKQALAREIVEAANTGMV